MKRIVVWFVIVAAIVLSALLSILAVLVMLEDSGAWRISFPCFGLGSAVMGLAAVLLLRMRKRSGALEDNTAS